MVDKLYIETNGKELASMEPYLLDEGGGPAAVGGSIICRSISGTPVVRIDGGGEHRSPIGEITVLDGVISIFRGVGSSARVRIHSGDEVAGEDGGTIMLENPEDLSTQHEAPAIFLNASKRNITINNKFGNSVIRLDGTMGRIDVGAWHKAGAVSILDSSGKQAIRMKGSNAALYLGGDGTEGDVVIFPTTAKALTDTNQASIVMNGSDGSIALGARRVFNTNDIQKSIVLNGKRATLEIGSTGTKEFGEGVGGKILIYPSIQENEQVQAQPSITLDGNSGDIFLENADCAEEFDISESTMCEPGTVMVLNDIGRLLVSSEPYDKRVVGVISGGGNFKPGIILDKKKPQKLRAPLAMLGKVYCKVDADKSPIKAGDMLTTSNTPGHAMKARNKTKAFGSVIGKALQSLNRGKELLPILIALQ